MKKITILFLLVSFAFIGYTQITFNQTYFDGVGLSVKQTSDNGYIATGYQYVNDSNHIVVIRTDESGDLIWTKNYGLGEGRSINLTNDGGYIIAGKKNISDSTYMGVWFKIDDSGDIVWSKEYSGTYSDEARYAEQTTDGGFIITGTTYTYDSVLMFLYHLILIKVDENGELDWIKTLDDGSVSGGNCVRQTEDEGFIVAGYRSTITDLGGGYLMKTDENGDSIWTYWGGNGYKSVEQTMDGGYIVSGCGLFYGGPARLHLHRFNEWGGNVWINAYSYPYFCWINEVHQTDDGGFIALNSVGELLKTNNDGDSLWMYSHFDNSIGRSVQQTSDGGYIMVGSNENLIALIKTDENGFLTGIDEFDVYVGIDIYPNPSGSTIAIELPAQPSKNTSLTILNTQGQQLITQPITKSKTEVSISHLPAGIYFIEVWDDKRFLTGKVVVE